MLYEPQKTSDTNWPPFTFGIDDREFVNWWYPDKSGHVWFWLNDSDDEDLCLEDIGWDEAGSRPEWVEWETDQMGWDGIIDPEWEHYADSGCGFKLGYRWRNWALQNGIAPFQPFRVWFGEPEYTTSYYGEHDVFYSWDIDYILPLSPFEVIRRWEHDLMMFARAKEEEVDGYHVGKQLRDHDLKAMWIERRLIGRGNSEGGWGWDEYYAHVSLESRHHYRGVYKTIAYAEAGDRDYDKATDLMVAEALEKLPHFTEEQIRGLKVRQYWS